jgi:hypothetical protein
VLVDVAQHPAHHRPEFLALGAPAFRHVGKADPEMRQPVAPRREQRIVGLQHCALAIEQVVEGGDRRIGARQPGELLVAQAGDPDRIDLHHAEPGQGRRRVGRRPEGAAQAEPVEQEGAQLGLADAPRRRRAHRRLTACR